MKTILIATGLVIVMGVAIQVTNDWNVTEVINETATTTEAVVEEEYPEEWLREAEEAAQSVLRRKKLENELDSVKQEKTSLRAEFDASDAILDARIEELEKELGVF